MNKHEFFCKLADQVTDNTWKTNGLIDRRMSNIEEKRESPKQPGTSIHLMQTICNRVKSGGVVSNAF